MPGGKIDLHIHTRHSDGHYPPAEVVRIALERGIETLSITDHDTIDGLRDSASCCKSAGVTFIPGIEFTTYVEDREIHLLSYFFNPADVNLNRLIEFCKSERLHRAERIVRKLQQRNVPLTMDDVRAESGSASITRPHIASALVNRKLVNSFSEAFDLYLSNSAPCYERKVYIDPKSIFDGVRNAGGLTFIAHPANTSETIITALIHAGLDGIETIHPSHSASQTKHLTDIANAYFLLTSGGSDFHGGRKQDDENLGKYFITQNTLALMRQHLPEAHSRFAR